MRVGLVLSGVAPSKMDPRLLEVAAAISKRHTVEVWAPPGAVSYVTKRLPSEVSVHHADDVERRAASSRLRLRRPRVLRKTGIGSRRIDGVLRKIKADLVILPTLAQAERAADVLPEGTAVLEWVPNVAGSIPSATRGEDARPGLVVAAGPLIPAARFGEAIRAFDLATTPDQTWTMKISGAGRHEQGLTDLITWRSLEQRVTLAPPGTAVGDARVLVSTAPYAVPGFQVIEAAAAGVPVVGFDDSPLAAVVAAAGGGYVVPPGSPEALGAALERLLADENVYERCAERARHFARDLGQVPEAERWLLIADAIAQRRSEKSAHQSLIPALAGPDEALALNREQTAAVEDLTSAVERQLSSAQVPYAFVSSQDGRKAVVTGAENRETIVRALMPASASGLGGVLSFVGRALAHRPLATAHDQLPEFEDVIDRFRVFNSDTAPGLYLDIELWTADAAGVRRAPRPNREAAALDEATWTRWMEARSSTVTGQVLWDEVTFPIDAVFTWVDGADPAWQERRDQYLPEVKAAGSEKESGADDERFLSRDEIYYAVAAAHKNMPWLRRMVVVTDGQRHERIAADFPDVEFVDHRDIFPDPSVLPVFNSHAIEACLHRIPDLAEHFVYFNDDMIVAQPLRPTDLFAGNGAAYFFPSPLTIDFVNAESTEPHLLAAANNRRLLARDFDVQIAHSMLHTPYPHLRSVLEEMEQRYSSEFDRTRAGRFRSGDDISVMSSFAQHYGWLTRRYQLSNLEYRFVRLNQDALPQRIDKVLGDPNVQIVALGEPMPGQERHPDEADLVEKLLNGLVS